MSYYANHKRIVGIYALRNVENGKLYVGSSIDITWRKYAHITKLNAGLHCNSYLQRAWEKSGADAFEFILLEERPESALMDREHFYITKYNTMNKKKGYNLIHADRHIISEETRSRISHALKGKKRPPRSSEWSAKIALRRTGLHHTEEAKAKISAYRTGKHLSDEGKEKVRQARLKYWADIHERQTECNRKTA